jgi:hypothetical protein
MFRILTLFMLNDLITFKEEDGGANWRLWVPKGQKLNVVRQTTLMNTTAVDSENYLRHFSYKSKIYRNVLNRLFCANKRKKERSESRGRKSRSRSMASSNDERKTIPRHGTAFRIGGIPLTWIICRLLFQVEAIRKQDMWTILVGNSSATKEGGRHSLLGKKSMGCSASANVTPISYLIVQLPGGR